MGILGNSSTFFTLDSERAKNFTIRYVVKGHVKGHTPSGLCEFFTLLLMTSKLYFRKKLL